MRSFTAPILCPSPVGAFFAVLNTSFQILYRDQILGYHYVVKVEVNLCNVSAPEIVFLKPNHYHNQSGHVSQ